MTTSNHVNLFATENTASRVDAIKALTKAMIEGQLIAETSIRFEGDVLAQLVQFGDTIDAMGTNYDKGTRAAAMVGYALNQAPTGRRNRAAVKDAVTRLDTWTKINGTGKDGKVPTQTFNRAWALAMLAKYGTKAQCAEHSASNDANALGAEKHWEGKADVKAAALKAAIASLKKAQAEPESSRGKSDEGKENSANSAVKQAENRAAQAEKALGIVRGQNKGYESQIAAWIAMAKNKTLTDAQFRAKFIEEAESAS